MSFLKLFTPSPQIPKVIPEKVEPPKPLFPKVDVTDFINSSYTVLPVKKEDLTRVPLPFVCSVTPIPKDESDLPIQEATYDYVDAPKCQNCNTLANSKVIMCPDNVCYLCNMCSKKSSLGIKAAEYVSSPQLNVPVVQFPFADVTKHSERIKNLLILEKTFPTVEKGLFNELVEKFIDNITKMDSGLFSFFVLTTGLTVPVISNDRTSFKISVYPDATDAILPSSHKMFFDLATEKELFIKCIRTLADSPRASIPMSTIFEVIDSVTTAFVDQNVFSTMVTCTINNGEIEEAKALGNKLLINNGHFDLFCMNPSPNNQPEYKAVAEFSMLNNSHLVVFNSIQIPNIINDILYRVFCKKSGRTMIMCTMPKFAGVADIMGCGIRRTSNSFTLTAVEPGDTIYFVYEYVEEKIDIPSPSFLFQMRLMKEDGTRYIRTAVYAFSIASNFASVMKKSNIGVFMSSFLIQAIEAGREASDEFKMQDEIDKIKNTIFDDNFTKMMLFAASNDAFRFSVTSLSVMKKLVNYVRAAEILSKAPYEIERYVTPKAYVLNLGNPNIGDPVYIHNIKLNNGALLIQYDDDHTAILLAANEKMEDWAAAINQEPLNQIIAAYSTARSIDLMHPQLSKESKVFVTIDKCMKAPLLQEKKN